MIAKDKIYHFIAGFLIALVTYAITQDINKALNITIVVGVLKEVYDRVSGKGTCEVLDAIATIVGGGIVCGVIYYLVH